MRTSIVVLAALTFSAGCSSPSDRERPDSTSSLQERWREAAGPVTPWPRPVPLRLRPEEEGDVLVTLLGEVETPLAEGVFDPVSDRVTLNDGTTIEHYYAGELDIPYYRPLDKSVFPVPPSGWCSWYYYYRQITPEEVLANARWIADNLLDYGARYVQIDDGWQARGDTVGGWRDWTGLDSDFQDLGMESLAQEIRALGLEAGIWLAPHGQSNETPARASGAFLWTPEGESVPSWVGRYLLDPTAPSMESYLTDLFEQLRSWGYTYFKIDGQTVVLREYERALHLMAGPVPEGEPAAVAADLYRHTLDPIRRTIGPGSYLLSSWGTAVPGVGILNGARTGGDVVLGRRGFLTGVSATQRWAFLHNVAWYSDPDVLLVRPPMTDGLARSWATMLALTGQSLMANDRLPDLPASRVHLLKRVFPATDIRPLDLYRPQNTRKSIVDLKVHHLDRSYDVVGVFNFGEEAQIGRHVSWGELGLPPDQAHHVFDFWSGVYLGSWKGGVFLDVPATDVRVLTVVPASERPTLISTDRHVTQGWVDLLELTEGGTPDTPTLSGRSRVIGGDDYTLTVGLPPGGPGLRLAAVDVRGEGARARATWQNHIGYATLTVASDVTQNVSWTMLFESSDVYVYPPRRPEGLEVTEDAPGTVRLTWRPEYYSIAGYQVEVDGEAVGVAFEPRAVLGTLEPGRTYTFGVREVWYDGSVGEEVQEVTYTVPGDGVAILLDPDHPEWTRSSPPVWHARFTTSQGDFFVEVVREHAPVGVDRFYNLVRLGYYDDTRFHRVREGYIAQFGLHGDPRVNAAWLDRQIADDPAHGSNLRGTMAFAMSPEPETRNTQVYINLADNTRNDAEPFAIFGDVVEGMEVLDRLYSGYGEQSGSGVRHGRQGPIIEGGNEYLDREFPLLDRILRATIVEHPRSGPAAGAG